MILQALCKYYYRKAVEAPQRIAAEGFEYKEIPFVLVLSARGKLLRVEDTRRKVGKQMRGRLFLVPHSEKRTLSIKPFLLWDNVEYALGLPVNGKPERVAELHMAFLQRIEDLRLEDAGVQAVLTFLKGDPNPTIDFGPHAAEIRTTNPFISFRLDGDEHLICERAAVVTRVCETPGSPEIGVCLVTGERAGLAHLQPMIRGVRNANATGGNLISYNLPSFNSYGKVQGANAPIGEKSTFAYTTALNYLLSRDSTQKLFIGDTTTVFWADQPSHFETSFPRLFEDVKDDPKVLNEAVQSLMQRIADGQMSEADRNTQFHVLGLAPNTSRLIVRFWHMASVAELMQRLALHFQDLEICHAPQERPHLPIWGLLNRLCVSYKMELVPAVVAGDWMRSILEGKPYPETVLQAVLRRVHAEQDINYPRAAILKAFINRRQRHSQPGAAPIRVDLDPSNQQPAYRLGRLLAVVEELEREAQPGIGISVRERIYLALTREPAATLPFLLQTKDEYFSQLASKQQDVFQSQCAALLQALDPVPELLDIYDQSRFAIAYYQQRLNFCRSKADSEARR